MIVAKIDGPLKRQLGQYLFARSYADAAGACLKLDATAFREGAQPEFALARFTFSVELADAEEIAAARAAGILEEATLLYEAPVLRPHGYLDGGWLDYRYGETAALALSGTLGLSAPIDAATRAMFDAIAATESVALDLRGQDAIPPSAYFLDALLELRARLPAAHVFVFTNDADDVARRITEVGAHTTVKGIGADEMLLMLMRACKHHIVTYDSIACLAARLAPLRAPRVVCAPQQAHRPNDAALLARYGAVQQPVWPDAWIRIPMRVPSPPPPLIEGGRSSARPIRVGIWNFYEEITTNGFLFKNAEASIGAGLLQPWIDLYTYGQTNGIDFVTLDQISGVDELDAVIFCDRPRLGNPLIERLMASDIVKYLILYECEVIKPDNWEVNYHEQFDRIFTWSDAHVDGRRYVKINFATETRPAYDVEVLKGAFQQRKLASMIVGAKASHHPLELYSHRLRTITWFESSAPQALDVYGGGWDATQHPCYRGRTRDKLATASNYRFSICYENAKGIPGYITEKILDCMRAGTVPVYGGAPNIARWIPSDCFIDIGQFETYPALYAHLRDMDAATHGRYLDRIEAFLAGPQAYPFSSACFVATMTRFVALDVATKRGERPVGAPAMSTGGDRVELVQNTATLAIEFVAISAPQLVEASASVTPPRESVAAAYHPDLIVCLSYGDELPVFKRARALWEFYLSYFPKIKAVFVRASDRLPRGEVTSNGYDLVVGVGADGANSNDAGYRDSGVWSANENAGQIYRNMAVSEYLLRKYDKPFYQYNATITSVVDFRGLMAVIESLPKTGCFAGMPGRLAKPPELRGLSYVCGTNTLFSRDVMHRLQYLYDPADTRTQLPNDIWQAMVLDDVPRICLPFFSFLQPRAPGANMDDVAQLTRRLLADGHFHFRIKTSSEMAGVGKREDVDPWVMLKIMETILDAPGAPHQNRALMAALQAFTGQGPHSFGSVTDDRFFRCPRAFALTDTEAPAIYGAHAGVSVATRC